MRLVAMVLLVAVGMAFPGVPYEEFTPDLIINSLMYTPCVYWKVMFALDSSGSIDSNEWALSKLAARDILAIINFIPHPGSIYPNGHEIGLVRFSCTELTKVIFSLGTYPYYPANDAAIAAVPRNGTATNMYKALRLCDGQLGDSDNRLVWMTTDGRYNEGGDPIPMATAMKKKEIIICVIAIGDDADMDVISAIASSITVMNTSVDAFSVKCVLRYNTYAEYKSATYAARLRVVPPELSSFA
ncbi:uncharacterized protein LOC106150910 [Lingula anatina]|uniref:Uncharacterized protein LOC106150910 n=1 Tax=Lingula anatina TaxID=7574 RepID=A0A1S3H058_LINAN|nr:uncharacterized protein LOC106150910 [Lingula anatina]|eukprot:XP_013379388.1 uncharacterized protein LOC106150910 [Lingula anatina]